MYFAIYKQVRRKRGLTPEQIKDSFVEGDSEETVAASLGLEICDEIIVHMEVVKAWRKGEGAQTEYFFREMGLDELNGAARIKRLR